MDQILLPSPNITLSLFYHKLHIKQYLSPNSNNNNYNDNDNVTFDFYIDIDDIRNFNLDLDVAENKLFIKINETVE